MPLAGHAAPVGRVAAPAATGVNQTAVAAYAAAAAAAAAQGYVYRPSFFLLFSNYEATKLNELGVILALQPDVAQ